MAGTRTALAISARCLSFREVRRVVAILSLCLAWLCANGVVWDVMQVAAWGRMFAGYSETMNFSQALSETLDPAKPCEMCVGIARAKQAAEKKLPTREHEAAVKFDLVTDVTDEPSFSHDRGEWSDAPPSIICSRSDPVRLRPPRV